MKIKLPQEIKNQFIKAGRKGGNSTLKKYNKEHFSKIRKINRKV